jgi:hypothetical protein
MMNEMMVEDETSSIRKSKTEMERYEVNEL